MDWTIALRETAHARNCLVVSTGKLNRVLIERHCKAW